MDTPHLAKMGQKIYIVTMDHKLATDSTASDDQTDPNRVLPPSLRLSGGEIPSHHKGR